jgi:glycosyltransferase involved in cell wall biosynthesis
MDVAVLTLTRNRLEYTKHCFDSLAKYAGCPFDHYVLDQGSTDGTLEWLAEQPVSRTAALPENIGISRGMNLLLEWIEDEGYDVIVKFDNDCELTQPNTLRDVCALALEGNALLSPRILGLNNPPRVTRELRIGAETIQDIPQIGGIFLAAPAWVYTAFRYNDNAPPWGGDDVEICAWFRREHGGTCGYVKRLEAWHYETTSGQHARYPDYFARTLVEGKVAL